MKELKVAKYSPKVSQKVATSDYFQIATLLKWPKRFMIFGLLLQENLSPIPFKNIPIWSHCSWVNFSKMLFHSLDAFSLVCFFKNGPIPASLSLSSSFQQLTENIFNIKILPMAAFKPRITGIGSSRFANWATTTALYL